MNNVNCQDGCTLDIRDKSVVDEDRYDADYNITIRYTCQGCEKPMFYGPASLDRERFDRRLCGYSELLDRVISEGKCMTKATTYSELLDRVISDGIAAARTNYSDDPHKLKGAVEGFEACRGKTVTEIVVLHAAAERAAQEARRLRAEDYWRYRCAALEVEWVLNVLSVGITQLGHAPLLPHLPTARAALKYAEIVGVRDAMTSAV